MSRRRAAIAALVAAGALAGCETSPVENPGGLGMGPLCIRQTSPFEFTKADLMPRMPGALRAGELELGLAATWTSRWANTDGRQYVGDGEAVWLTATVGVGMTDRAEFVVELPVAWHGGGGMDGLISFFHDLAGMTDNERDDFPENGFRFEMHDFDGSDWIVDSGDKGAFFEDPFLRLSFLVAEGEGRAPRTSLDVTVRLGGGRAEKFLADPGPELALGVTLAEGWGDWDVYAGAAHVWVSADGFGGVELSDTRIEGFLAAEWQYRPGASAVAQWLWSTPFAEDFMVYAKGAHEIHVGLKWQAGPATTVELGMVENFVNFDSSPDLGFHFGVRRRF